MQQSVPGRCTSWSTPWQCIAGITSCSTSPLAAAVFKMTASFASAMTPAGDCRSTYLRAFSKLCPHAKAVLYRPVPNCTAHRAFDRAPTCDHHKGVMSITLTEHHSSDVSGKLAGTRKKELCKVPHHRLRCRASLQPLEGSRLTHKPPLSCVPPSAC